MQSTLGSGASPRVSKLICILVSLVVATLSWKFVELPFRNPRNPIPRISRIVLFQLAAAAAVVAAFGIAPLLFHGFPSRYPSGAIQVASYLNYDSAKYSREGSCFITSGYEYRNFDPAQCLQVDPQKKNYLLLGDSHAALLWYGLSSTLSGVNVLQATVTGCRPTVDQPALSEDRCKRLMNYVFADFLPNHAVDRLLIAARWQDGDLAPLSRTLNWARERGIVVVLLGPMIQYDAPFPGYWHFQSGEMTGQSPMNIVSINVRLMVQCRPWQDERESTTSRSIRRCADRSPVTNLRQMASPCNLTTAT